MRDYSYNRGAMEWGARWPRGIWWHVSGRVTWDEDGSKTECWTWTRPSVSQWRLAPPRLGDVT